MVAKILKQKVERILLRLIIVLLVFSLVVSTELFVAANTNDQLDVACRTVKQRQFEGEFSYDNVLVMLTNEASLKLHDWDVTDFQELDAGRIIIVNDFSVDALKMQQEQALPGEKVANQSYIDEKTFNTILRIDLNNPGREQVLNAIRLLENREDVLIAEPNHIYRRRDGDLDFCPDATQRLVALSNQPGLREQWAINNIGLNYAWGLTEGASNIKVGIMDGGMDVYHPFLRDNICLNLSESFIEHDDNFGIRLDHGTHVGSHCIDCRTKCYIGLFKSVCH